MLPWAAGPGGGTGPSCSTDTPAPPDPHTSARHAGTRPLSPCHHSPVLNKVPAQGLVHGWDAWAVQKTGTLGQRLGWHSRSCRPVLKQGWEVNIFSPVQRKQSFPFPLAHLIPLPFQVDRLCADSLSPLFHNTTP